MPFRWARLHCELSLGQLSELKGSTQPMCATLLLLSERPVKAALWWCAEAECDLAHPVRIPHGCPVALEVAVGVARGSSQEQVLPTLPHQAFVRLLHKGHPQTRSF